jgi:hypothetical protein
MLVGSTVARGSAIRRSAQPCEADDHRPCPFLGSLVGLSVTEGARTGTGDSGSSTIGEWVVTLDIESPADSSIDGELTVRGLAAAVAGNRTYIAARGSGYSFTVILGTAGAETALSKALGMLEVAQRRAGLDLAPVVCAEVTLVGTRPVPAASGAQGGCENPAS